MFVASVRRNGREFLTETYATQAEAEADAPALIAIENAHDVVIYRDVFASTAIVAHYTVAGRDDRCIGAACLGCRA